MKDDLIATKACAQQTAVGKRGTIRGNRVRGNREQLVDKKMVGIQKRRTTKMTTTI